MNLPGVDFQSHGILLYSVVYVNCILLSVFAMTGRWTFLLLFVLTLGLAGYVAYLLSTGSEHLRKVGAWADSAFRKLYAKAASAYRAAGGGERGAAPDADRAGAGHVV